MEKPLVASLTHLRSDRARTRRVRKAAEARRALRAVGTRTGLGAGDPRGTPGRGRVWINGRELGRPDARYAHLGRSHD